MVENPIRIDFPAPMDRIEAGSKVWNSKLRLQLAAARNDSAHNPSPFGQFNLFTA